MEPFVSASGLVASTGWVSVAGGALSVLTLATRSADVMTGGRP
jgi:hypothetical protein